MDVVKRLKIVTVEESETEPIKMQKSYIKIYKMKELALCFSHFLLFLKQFQTILIKS